MESFEDKSTVASEEENTKKENATRKDENSTLNGFFSDKDILDTLYRTKNNGEKMK